nr:MAG TPA: hypothetical protein [Bacteriophage sp.]
MLSHFGTRGFFLRLNNLFDNHNFLYYYSPQGVETSICSRRIVQLIAKRRFFYIRNPDYVGRATNTIPSGNKSSPFLERGFRTSRRHCRKWLVKQIVRGLQNVKPYNFQF